MIMFLVRKKRKCLCAQSPDFVEQRGANFLLIWKNIPHWMIIDSEFYSLLKHFDGAKTLQELTKGLPIKQRFDRRLSAGISNLLSLGILTEVDKDFENQPKTMQPKTPLIENIVINITRKCNLHCNYCYNANFPEVNINLEPEPDQIISLLEQTKPFLSAKPSLTILGGEPLLYPDKVLFLSNQANRMGFKTLVSTNGTTITDDICRHARKVGLEVQVSIDGHKPELNNTYRGKGTFQKAITGVKTLVKHRVYTIMSMVCFEENFPYLEDFYRLAHSLNVNEARFIPLKSLGRAKNAGRKPPAIETILKSAASMLEKNVELRYLTGRDCLSIIANECRCANKRQSCGTGLQTFLLDTDGSIYPCLNLNNPKFKVANITDSNFRFSHVWQNSPVLKNIRSLTSVQNPDKPCSECIVKYWCLGGCHGETYANTGSLKGRAYNCKDLRKSIIAMLWMLADNSDWIKRLTKIG